MLMCNNKESAQRPRKYVTSHVPVAPIQTRRPSRFGMVGPAIVPAALPPAGTSDPLVLLVWFALRLSASLAWLKAGRLGAGRLLTDLWYLCKVVNVTMGLLLQRVLPETEAFSAPQASH